MSSSDKIYLVRSSGYILGPYSKKEVQNNISNGTFSFYDDLLKPQSTGLALQDHVEFKEFINNLSMQNHFTNFIVSVTDKLTMTNKMRKTDQTHTVTKTEDFTNPATSTLQDTDKAEEIPFKVLDQHKSSAKPLTTNQYQSTFEHKQAVKKKVSNIVKRVWQFITLTTVIVSCFVLFQLAVVPYQVKQKLIKSIQEDGLRLYKAKNYKEALVFFQKGLNAKLLTSDEKKILSLIFLSENQLEKAESLMRKTQSSYSKDEVFLIKALINLKERSYSSAKKNLLSIKNGKTREASINLALLHWIQKDYQTSLKYIREVKDSGYDRELLSYLQILNQVALNGNTAQIMQAINNSLVKSPEYSQELYLLLAYLHSTQNNKKQVQYYVKKSLDMDPNFQDSYQYSPWLHSSYFKNWAYLFPYCEKIFAVDQEDIYLKAFYGFCYLKNNQSREAFKFFEKAKNQNPNDELILSLYAYKLFLEGSDSKAEVILENLKSDYHLPYILKARMAEKNEQWSFALRTWETFFNKNPKHLSAIAGLAMAHYNSGNISESKFYKEKGLAYYPHHVLLLSLKN